MPLRLDIKRKLTARSDRVKCVDLHPTEQWMLASLYNGNVHVWNHESQQLVKSFEVCDLPVRAAKFVPRKNWIVTGSDDMQVRVFNYNTLERVHAFEAHSDYVRCIAVHPTQPYLLTSSDDMLIKLWNWDKQWSCQQVFEGHTHYVMQIVINPKDNNTFASASLDRTVKVWQLGSSTPNFTLEGHEKGVNCVDYYHGGDKPYLISGADDRLVKIWDYQNKTCVQTLEGHAQNISAVCFHPELPIVLTGSEDGTVRIWHAGTYRLESSLNYGLERVWTVACMRGSNNVALGYDEGSIMVKVGREEPAVSMDASGGKIIWARHSEVQQANLKAMGEGAEIKDGERLPLAVKDMGSCDIYPQTIAHNPNGRKIFGAKRDEVTGEWRKLHNAELHALYSSPVRNIKSRRLRWAGHVARMGESRNAYRVFVVVCGDGEYIIYTAMALRNKAYGSAQEFVWAQDSSEYATREGSSTVKVFKNFKEKKAFKPEFGAEASTCILVRERELVCLATEESYFILKYDAAIVARAHETKEGLTEDGVEEAFTFLGETHESVRTGLWVGDCFIYTNGVNRINYYVGGEIVTVSHLDRTMYLLGYVPRDNRLYLGDKELNVVSYSLLLSVLEYQTAVMRGDFETADRVLPTIPRSQRTRGFKQQALAVSTDPEHKFELALQLGELETAHSLALEAASQQKWRQLAELATTRGELDLAQECLHHAQDYGGLLLLATSSGDAEMVKKLGETADATGKNNVSFLSYFLLGDVDKCLEILISTNRLPEAAFFARSYLPSRITEVVALWRECLSKLNEKAGQSLADPKDYENLFPGYADALKTEQFLKAERQKLLPASEYPNVTPNYERNPMEEMRAAEAAGKFHYIPPGVDVDAEVTKQEDLLSSIIPAVEKLEVTPSQSTSDVQTSETAPSKTKTQSESLEDELDLDLDNIDTLDVNIDEDLLLED
ncbi:Coatomer subunit beta' [Periplaneta americana]|uniref:Coatomer subunit beta' n=1 Tax=Periplaneta americana TaxID=6978 RepID=A0ABQ8TW31_PERAM|nr:Coatomer subunit beta' [Periplaneta americana]